MGMPSVSISFAEAAKSIQKRTETGVVGLILKDDVPAKNPAVCTEESEVPATLSDENKLQIKLALKGAERTPQKVIAFVIAKDASSYNDAFDYFSEVSRLDYIAVPTVVKDNQVDAVAAWIATERADYKIVKAVLPNKAADSIGVVNFATAEVKQGEKKYTAADYCSRIAGILASTPLTESATFKALPELTGCTKVKRSEMNTQIDQGKFLVFWDGEKVKVASGVNSFQTTSTQQGEQFKKIHIVDVMDVMMYDIRTIAEDNYIGRFTNSYANKCLLLGAIGNYLDELAQKGILKDVSVEIDVAANKQYLIKKGVDVSTMTDVELKEAATGNKVFLRATMKILDAIEEIVLPIVI